jgi:3-isopropylmalate/(R)-2-methylmalate dehydratase small subunit
MSEPIVGRVVKIGDDVNTDMIIPGGYLNMYTPEGLGPHLLETYTDPSVPERLTAGDIIVAGRNCGSGSSREQAQLAIMGRGVQALVAESFARIFQRNCLNLGVLAIQHAEAARAIQDGDTLTIDLDGARMAWSGGEAELPVQPEFVQDMLALGGIVGWVRKRLAEKEAAA